MNNTENQPTHLEMADNLIIDNDKIDSNHYMVSTKEDEEKQKKSRNNRKY